MEDVPIFRVGKKRKAKKAPFQSRDPSTSTLASSEVTPQPGVEDIAEDDETSRVVRLQRHHPSRKAGITFTASRRPDYMDGNAGVLALELLDASSITTEPLKGIPGRFVGSSGQVVDVDDNMMAYVDSEMSKSKLRHVTTQNPQEPGKHYANEPQNSFLQATDKTVPSLTATPTQVPTTNPYQLSEVPLPPPPPSPPPPRPRIRKPRLDRNGKPLPPRKPRRRPSDDLVRDALVERLLHEHRPDITAAQANITNEGAQANSTTATTAQTPALTGQRSNDEEFAARFRADFLNRSSERQARDEARRATTKALGAASDVKTGPKLGGSRTDRAKMAQLQQQQHGGASGK